MLLTLATLLGCTGSPSIVMSQELPYGPREIWDAYYNGYLNISLFAFRDADRDGKYELGERPMSGIVVDVVGNKRTVSTSTNLSGFANFRMSASDPEMEITFAGRYDFHANPPPGWQVTSSNEVQSIDFELRPGAPADLIATPAPAPVGLAPPLSIEGWAAPEEAIEVTSPSGSLLRATADQHGRYAIEAGTPGLWRVEQRGTGRIREITIGANPVVLSATWTESSSPCGGASETISFDDLLSEGILKVPSGYHGLGWSNFVMTHQKFYGSEGYRNNAVSGEFLAYNGSGHPVSLSSDAPFDLVGGYFGASSLEAEGETLIIRAWRGDDLAFEDRFTLSAMGAVYFSADYTCVTRIEFETLHFWQFTLDDLEVRRSG